MSLIRSIAASAFLLALAGSAMAADLPMKAKAPPLEPIYNWTGFYIGANGGWGGGQTNHTDNFGVTTGNFNTNGGVIGVTYGYNWQFGRFVVGFEGDFDYASINGSLNSAALCSVAGGATCITNMKNFGTDRIRVGYDVNGWLLYGTGGVGYGQVTAGQTPCGFIAPNPRLGVGGGFACREQWRSGWVAGAGVEKSFAPNWSAKLEYLHYDFGRAVNYIPTILPAGTALVSVLERGDMVRVGVNYHFNWAMPVVAKY